MIVVFGSINIDLVVQVQALPKAGQTVLGAGYDKIPGGKGANQALAAARAGAEVELVGCVGVDGFADDAVAMLRQAGVRLNVAASAASPTGCAFIGVDGAGENQIIVASGANADLTPAQLSDASLDNAAAVVLQMEVLSAANWAVVERAGRFATRVLLNAAPAGYIPSDVLSALEWLIVNEDEARQVAQALGLAHETANDAARAISRSARTGVVVTLGPQGARAFCSRDGEHIRVSVDAPNVTVSDTTGAGDAFVGAFAERVATGTDLPDALRYAVAAGSLACTKQGAQPSFCSANEILALARTAPVAQEID